jgi:hypothetical protein
MNNSSHSADGLLGRDLDDATHAAEGITVVFVQRHRAAIHAVARVRHPHLHMTTQRDVAVEQCLDTLFNRRWIE